MPELLEPGFVWENVVKYKATSGGEKTLQYTVKGAFLQFGHPVVCNIAYSVLKLCLWLFPTEANF